jgi:phenylacetate-CoA ligase
MAFPRERLCLGEMAVYRSVARHVLAPAVDLVRGSSVMPLLKDLEESQWWSRERLEVEQALKLRRLIAHAFERVPYYRRLMEEHGVRPADIVGPADLPRLPVLTKEHIRTHATDLLADGFPRSHLLSGRTGGSAGTPLCFYSSRESRLSHGLARSLRAMEWAGVHLGDQTVIVSKRGARGAAASSMLQAISRRALREVFVDATSLTDSSLRAVVEHIARIRPRSLRGYSSAVAIIAEFIRDAGMTAPQVGSIVVGGEQLFDEHRALLTEVFGVQPFSRYSSFENYDIAMECEAHAGMHVAAEDLMVEIVDGRGNPVPPGEKGRLLVTNLHEYGMPLIRYDTDDESSFSSSVCPCGRQLPLIVGVVGKTGNVIYTPSGKRLSPLTLGSSTLAPMGVRQFQFEQDALDHVTVRLVPDHQLDYDSAATLPPRVAAHFGRVLGEDVRVDVIVVDRIEPTPAGKHLFLISRVTRPTAMRQSGGAG